MPTTPEEIQQLIDSLESYEDERVLAITRLVDLGDEAVPALIAAVESGEGRRCWGAAQVLAKLLDPRAIPALTAALATSRPLLGTAAVTALIAYPDHDPTPDLLAALPTAHPMVQQNIILAFQQRPNPVTITPLMDMLPTLEAPLLRYTIIQTLGNLHATQAIPLIRTYIDDPDHHVRKWAEYALKQLADSQNPPSPQAP